jgi:hypothetical protein
MHLTPSGSWIPWYPDPTDVSAVIEVVESLLPKYWAMHVFTSPNPIGRATLATSRVYFPGSDMHKFNAIPRGCKTSIV